MRIEISNICTWDKDGVGTKVLKPQVLESFLESRLAIGGVEFDKHGHAFIPCPSMADYVSCGVGKNTNIPGDYVLRSYRGKVSAYLKREKAEYADFVAIILYTREGYLNDPDVLQDPAEMERIQASDCQYVIVCVLASAGPKAPVDGRRFCANLAGGNPEWAEYDQPTLIKMAAETTAYHDEWCTVSD